ncbi:MAG: putative RNA-binding Zn ribbon-like protein [Oceanospirillaceae bacterium]|jgi:predicted RNA-binding Zn ribbon-like protein
MIVSMINNKPNFYFVANNLAIDFVNTTIQKHLAAYELINNPTEFLFWAADAGAKLQANQPAFEMQSIYHLRQALKALFEAKIQGINFPDQALVTLNQHLIDAPVQQKLLQVGQEVSLQPVNSELTISKFLGEIAHQAAKILISAHKQPIKSCASEKCILMFLDTSRSKKRRWCSMDLCGNRSKAAAFYQAAKP